MTLIQNICLALSLVATNSETLLLGMLNLE